MNVPGITAKHCIISSLCREVQGGDLEAFDEAVRRIREEYARCIPAWPREKGAKFHLVLTVERAEP